jgi:TPR repeat protein
MYEFGRGVGRDVVRARALYDKACMAKNTHGCVNLGGLLETAYSQG